jgi:hypothetical protein
MDMDILAEKEKEIAKLQDAVEKAIIALDQTKKIFKSKTIAKIRENLIEVLPPMERTKFVCLECGIKRDSLILYGYQPKSDNLGKANPPKGGSFLK